MDKEIKIKTEDPAMAETGLTNTQSEGAKDDAAERLARFAANRLELERLKRAVEAAKEAKKEALRLKLEKEELEDKRIQEEILRMKAVLEELNQPSPEGTSNLQPTQEVNGDPHEQIATPLPNGHEQSTAEDTQETNGSQRFNGLSEDVENLITQEAAKGLSPGLSRNEAARNQENGASEARNGARRELAASNGAQRTESLVVDNSYASSDEVLRTYLTASVDGSSRSRLADYLKECEKFFKVKSAWATRKQIEFAMLHLVGGLLTSWRESATRLKSPTWEDYKIALFKANHQLERPQTHRCERCKATFGSDGTLSEHLSQSRPCKPLISPHSPTARKITRPHIGTDISEDGTNGIETQVSPRRKSTSCAQCKLTFPSTVDLGRHRDATGHTIVSPVQPKSTLIRAPTGPRIPETSLAIPGLPTQSQITYTCQVCKISFKNHNDLVQHQRNSEHVGEKERESPAASNSMGAPAHLNYNPKRHSFPDAANTNGRGTPRLDNELDRRTCRKCDTTFPNRVEMHEHLRDSGHAVPTFPPKHQRSNPNPFPEHGLSLHQRTSTGGGVYANAQQPYSSSQDDDYIGLGPNSDSPQRSRSYKDPLRTCEKCDTEFPTRIEMFEHIREVNHVMPRKRVWQGRYEDDGGLGGRVSAVRRRTEY